MDNNQYEVPELTANNYVDWITKMKSVLRAKELYQLVIGKEPTKARGEDGKIMELDHSLRLDKAHALIITRIHSSISGRVRKNGGDDCPKILWANILEFGASKKEANIFKAWYRLLHLPLRSNKVPEFISAFWDGIAILQSLDASIDDQILGHIVLMKIPHGLKHIRDSIIASGTSSSTPVTYEMVLELLDSQIKADSSVGPSSTSQPTETDESTLLWTQKCSNGRHDPSAPHSAEKCFSLHPELLVDYRRHMKNKKEAEAHLAELESPVLLNAEVITNKDQHTVAKQENNKEYDSDVSLL